MKKIERIISQGAFEFTAKVKQHSASFSIAGTELPPQIWNYLFATLSRSLWLVPSSTSEQCNREADLLWHSHEVVLVHIWRRLICCKDRDRPLQIMHVRTTHEMCWRRRQHRGTDHPNILLGFHNEMNCIGETATRKINPCQTVTKFNSTMICCRLTARWRWQPTK